MGIREREKILPGSLLKIPLAMAIMRKAELDRDLLERQLVFSGRPEGAPVQMFDTPGRLETGKSYRVAELVERMLRFSDNDAIGPLREIVPDDEFDGVLRDLNVGQGAAEGYQADLKTLSSFMRTLYNAGYLTIESAERLLEILSDPWFDRGIAAGVPEGVVVASKYGDTIKQVKGTDYFQFHEFGIVYLPTQPYLIGVYAVGAEMDRLVEFTRDVSAITFAEVESQVAATRK
jgi:beta-lactamase class A